MRVDDYSYLLTMFNTPRRSRLSAALQNLSGNEMVFFCNIIICSNEKFWLLFKLFDNITFKIMKPIYIPSFINAQAVLICFWSFKETTNPIKITD